MSDKSVALIRGINVGRAKRVAMADLRALVQGLGYRDVKTLLNSGNVVFSSEAGERDKVAARIEQALLTDLGIRARVIVLSASEVSSIAGENLLSDIGSNPSRLLIAIPSDPAELQRLQPVVSEHWAPEKLVVGSRAAYLWCPDGVLKSRLWTSFGKVLEDRVTTRNWKTFLRIHRLVSGKQ